MIVTTAKHHVAGGVNDMQTLARGKLSCAPIPKSVDGSFEISGSLAAVQSAPCDPTTKSMVQSHAEPGISAMLVSHLSMAVAYTHSGYVASTIVYDGMVLPIDSGASKYIMSNISPFRSFDEYACIVSFMMTAGTMITS